jgi:hypothetical protein
LTLTRLSPLVCGEVKNAREKALVPDVLDLAAGQVDRSVRLRALQCDRPGLWGPGQKRQEHGFFSRMFHIAAN